MLHNFNLTVKPPFRTVVARLADDHANGLPPNRPSTAKPSQTVSGTPCRKNHPYEPKGSEKIPPIFGKLGKFTPREGDTP
jgi:hypothetical protein